MVTARTIRPAWTTQQIPGHPGLISETMSNKQTKRTQQTATTTNKQTKTTKKIKEREKIIWEVLIILNMFIIKRHKVVWNDEDGLGGMVDVRNK